jgi:protein-disulfide isomerase
MQAKFSITAAIAVVSLFTLAACGATPQDVRQLEERVDKVAEQQKEVLVAIAGLAKGQKDILAKPAAAPARPGRPKEDPNKVYKIPVGGSYAKGPEDAKVTIVEFSDFQCPFCARATGLMDQLVEAYPNDVRLVYKNFPLGFHKQAMPAALASIAAGKQGKFWEMHDIIFENYKTLADDQYPKYAETIGIDVEQFKTDMASKSTQDQVNTEMREASAAGVRGTPTFFINGKKPQGRSFDIYKGIIDTEIKKAS